MLTKKPVIKAKVLTMFRPMILSRHPTHSPLRTELPKLPFRSVVRLGSTTDLEDTVTNGGKRIEINTIDSIKNSSSKLRMKECFSMGDVKTAEWWDSYEKVIALENIPFPIISKSHYGSRGMGNTKFDTLEELQKWAVGKKLNNYIFEKFVKMTREYRLHITEDGCFYTCRKLLKNDAPEGTWQRHDDVCSWALEENPSFKKPNNWNLIVEDCVKALKSLGLDIGAFDVMVQGAKDGKERENPEWNICESCSAPSFGEVTVKKYIEELPKILKKKYGSDKI